MEEGTGGGFLQAQGLRAAALDPDGAISTPDISDQQSRWPNRLRPFSMREVASLCDTPRHVGVGVPSQDEVIGRFEPHRTGTMQDAANGDRRIPFHARW